MGSSGPFQEILPATRCVEDVREHRVGGSRHPNSHKTMARPLAEDLPGWIFGGRSQLKQGEKGREGSYLEKTNGRALWRAQYPLSSPASHPLLCILEFLNNIFLTNLLIGYRLL